MRRVKLIWLTAAVVAVALIGLSVVPRAAAQSVDAAPVQISGVVQSFSGNTLDIKPAASPAVWVMVPSDLHLDRDALKAGAQVSAEAHWDGLCYIATDVTIKK